MTTTITMNRRELFQLISDADEGMRRFVEQERAIEMERLRPKYNKWRNIWNRYIAHNLGLRMVRYISDAQIEYEETDNLGKPASQYKFGKLWSLQYMFQQERSLIANLRVALGHVANVEMDISDLRLLTDATELR